MPRRGRRLSSGAGANGFEALQRFVTERGPGRPLDTSMPARTAWDVLEQIKELSPRTPVVLFTAGRTKKLLPCQDDLALSAAACVEKADDLAELKRAVTHALRRRPAEGGDLPMRMGLPPVKMEHPC